MRESGVRAGTESRTRSDLEKFGSLKHIYLALVTRA